MRRKSWADPAGASSKSKYSRSKIHLLSSDVTISVLRSKMAVNSWLSDSIYASRRLWRLPVKKKKKRPIRMIRFARKAWSWPLRRQASRISSTLCSSNPAVTSSGTILTLTISWTWWKDALTSKLSQRSSLTLCRRASSETSLRQIWK